MPSRFQTMKCAASELLTTSTAWMLLAYSWPMRWKMRSPPERSTRTGTPGYLASNALAIRSATGRSTAVYQLTLPSFCAAAISSGVTLVGAGAAADATGVSIGSASGVAARPCSRSRRVMLGLGIVLFPPSPFRDKACNGFLVSTVGQDAPTSVRRGTALPSLLLEPPSLMMEALDQKVEEHANLRDLLRAGCEHRIDRRFFREMLVDEKRDELSRAYRLRH